MPNGKYLIPNYCIDCKIEIRNHYAKRCRKCAGLYIKQENLKKPKKEPLKGRCIDCSKETKGRGLRCRSCDNKFRMKFDTYKKKMSECKIGKNNHWYKHGLTALVTQIRNLPQSKKWRLAVYKKDDYTCIDCQVKGGQLEAHHKRPFNLIFQDFISLMKDSFGIEEAKLIRFAKIYKPFWDVSNGETNCKKCHRKKPRK